MTITLGGSSLTIEKVELDPGALKRMKVCRAMVEEKLAAKEIGYFWNSLTCSSLSRTSENSPMPVLVPYMIYNHAAGIGEPAPIEHVRAALAGRINVHAHGNSGCRPGARFSRVHAGEGN